MATKAILITGTPCTGKTSAARLLTMVLDAFYINLTQLATKEKLIKGTDKKRDSIIIDETRMQRRIQELLENSRKNHAVIDGHYAVSVVPEKLVTHVFVLRRDPTELKTLMQRCHFSGAKLWENLAAEILDVCLVEALSVYPQRKICELDATGKPLGRLVDEMLEYINGNKKCCVGVVDWLAKLESKGALQEYLRI
jgi:adenylate kinase